MKSYTAPIRITIFLLLCLISLSGCQPKSTATEPSPTQETATEAVPVPQEEDTLTISKDIFLDPALAEDADSLKVSQYLYEGLVRLDEKGEIQPALAESWVISDDQLDYIFTLRAGLTFSDGTRITPDTVEANFNRWFDTENPLHGENKFPAWERVFLGFHNEKDAEQRAKSTVDGIQKVDVNTILVHLNRPVPDLLTYLADPAFTVLSIDALSTTDGYGGRDSTIISSGPYIVKNWADTGLTLSPNPKYWGTPPEGDINFTLQ
jgi:ABC-type transport system substrate-binding protein